MGSRSADEETMRSAPPDQQRREKRVDFPSAAVPDPRAYLHGKPPQRLVGLEAPEQPPAELIQGKHDREPLTLLTAEAFRYSGRHPQNHGREARTVPAVALPGCPTLLGKGGREVETIDEALKHYPAAVGARIGRVVDLDRDVHLPRALIWTDPYLRRDVDPGGNAAALQGLGAGRGSGLGILIVTAVARGLLPVVGAGDRGSVAHLLLVTRRLCRATGHSRREDSVPWAGAAGAVALLAHVAVARHLAADRPGRLQRIGGALRGAARARLSLVARTIRRPTGDRRRPDDVVRAGGVAGAARLRYITQTGRLAANDAGVAWCVHAHMNVETTLVDRAFGTVVAVRIGRAGGSPVRS
jgi:hypothetical protein